MSDDSEPGEIKSPDISSVIRPKRSTDERRSYKSEKRLRIDREIKDYIRSDYKEYDRRGDYRDDKKDYDKREFEKREFDKREFEKREFDKREFEKREFEKREFEKREFEKREFEKREFEKREFEKREERKQNYNREEERRGGGKEEVRASKVRLKDSEKRRSEDEKIKDKREEKAIREKMKQISEELKGSSKKKDKSPGSGDRKERKKDKDVEKKKKKDKEGKKIKDKSSKASASEKYQLLLKERLSENPVPQSPEEVSVTTATTSSTTAAAATAAAGGSVDRKKRSLLVDSSDTSDQEASEEEMAADPSPVPHNSTPSPSPPPDPLAGLPPYYPALQGCRNVDHFEYLNRIEEGTYGVVFRARDKRTNETVALKKLKMEKEKQGFPITSLREINTLLKGQHQNVVHVREIVVGSNMDKIYIVMNYVEHDLKSLMENMKEQFLIGEVKTMMRQLCEGLKFLHDNWIIHRDIKTSNLLFSHGGILKIGDFGLAREYGSPLKQYTEIVVTLWYRAPELLLGCKLYSVPIDIWSAGCVFGELLGQKPLFPGKSEIDQLNKIFKELGTPNEKIWPGWSELPATQRYSFANHPYNNLRNRFPPSQLTEKGFNLLNSLLCYDPARRITAAESLRHPWYDEAPLPVDPSMFPTWPAKSEMNANPKKKQKSPTPPSGGGAADKLENSGFKFLTALSGNSAKGPGFSLKF